MYMPKAFILGMLLDNLKDRDALVTLLPSQQRSSDIAFV